MTNEPPLAAEFPPATREDWLKLVRAALKDRPFDRLIAKTYDGIAIEPLYERAADARPIVARRGPWQVHVRVDHPDPAAANAEALHELANGATGLNLIFAGSVGSYGFGLPADAEAIARTLEGVHLDAVSLELETAEASKDAADHVAALVRTRGLSPDKVNIRFGHDAIGAHTLTGALPIPYRELMPRFGEHVASLAKAGFKGPLAAADGRIVHNAGGSEAQELAYVLSVAVAYLRALEGAGIALEKARGMVGFRLAADADQFLTIAKFRALRKLWARAEEACGLAPQRSFVSADTAWRMMTQRDPHVNMLRTTIAAFSAGVGGADAITVLPFTAALGLPDRFARRIARNIQLLLLEESHIAKVADPAAGSGAIEALTDELCRPAWALFQEIEKAGGAPAALERGLIQEKVAAVRAAREAAVAHRRDALTGTSDFPLLSEAPVSVVIAAPQTPSPPPLSGRSASEASRQGGKQQIAAAAATPLPNALPHSPPRSRSGFVSAERGGTREQAEQADRETIKHPALAPIRLAEPFEKLRDASDAMLARTGARPKIFLANLGTPAEFTARATFAKNFFEAGGIEAVSFDPSPREAVGRVDRLSEAKAVGVGGSATIQNVSPPNPRPLPAASGGRGEDTAAPKTDLGALVAAFKTSGAKLACLCSSDAVYEREAANAAKALAAAGAMHIYLAGRPKDQDALKAAGVGTFIYAGCDALATLKAAHDMLRSRG
jgi:methylmalonyl-CoA mutase